MRRIEFLAPVEAMRGNLSGNQKLLYPTQDNSAWDSPAGKRNYATNYETRYIGNKRAATGQKYFSVKTKSAVTMSPAMRRANGLLACSSTFADIIRTDLSILSQLQDLFLASYEKSIGWTFKRWISNIVRQGLINKSGAFYFDPAGTPSPSVQNPFSATVPDQSRSLYAGDKTYDVIRNTAKFWEYLGVDGSKLIPVYLAGKKYFALAITGISFRSQYGAAVPSTFEGIPFNRLLVDQNMNAAGSAQWVVSSSPDVDAVKATGFDPDRLAEYTLYRHEVGQTAEDDVAVNASDEFEEGYVYTLKK